MIFYPEISAHSPHRVLRNLKSSRQPKTLHFWRETQLPKSFYFGGKRRFGCWNTMTVINGLGVPLGINDY